MYKFLALVLFVVAVSAQTCTQWTGQTPTGQIYWALKETAVTGGTYLSPNTAQNGYLVLEFKGTNPYIFTCAQITSQSGAIFECDININGQKWDMDGGIGGAWDPRLGSQNFAIGFYYDTTRTNPVYMRGIQVSYPSNWYNLDIMYNLGTDYELSYGNINRNGVYQVYICTYPTPAPTIAPSAPPSPAPTAAPTAAPPTCVPWTGQAVTSGAYWTLKETSVTGGTYLIPSTAQNGYVVLEFKGTTPYLYACAMISPPQSGAIFECDININGQKWDMDGGIGGAWDPRLGSQYFAIGFYYDTTRTNPVYMRGIQVGYPSNWYNLDIMYNLGTDYELSYGNINRNGVYQVQVCYAATPAPTIAPSASPSPAPTGPPTQAPPTCHLWTGQAVNSAAPITWALLETTRGKYLQPNIAQNGYAVLEFAAATPYQFSCPTPFNPPQNGAGFECYINIGSDKYDLDGGIGGAWSKRTGSQYFSIGFFYNAGTGVTTLEGIYAASPSTYYTLGIMWNNGNDYELSYGNLNYGGTYNAYICY